MDDVQTRIEYMKCTEAHAALSRHSEIYVWRRDLVNEMKMCKQQT